jgi:hypothetical protein
MPFVETTLPSRRDPSEKSAITDALTVASSVHLQAHHEYVRKVDLAPHAVDPATPMTWKDHGFVYDALMVLKHAGSVQRGSALIVAATLHPRFAQRAAGKGKPT